MSAKTCSLIQPLLGAYLDGEIGSEAAQTLAEHLDGCDGCRHVLAQLAEADRLLREAAPDLPTEERWAEIEAHLLARARARWIGRTARVAAVAAAAALLLGALVWLAGMLDRGPRTVVPEIGNVPQVEENAGPGEQPLGISVERRG